MRRPDADADAVLSAALSFCASEALQINHATIQVENGGEVALLLSKGGAS